MSSKHLDINTALVAGVKQGNEEAARQLYRVYSQAMYNTLIRIVGNTSDAQDLLQEAFVEAFSNISSLRQSTAFAGWLKQIVVNKGLGFLRKRKMQFEKLGEEWDAEDEMDDEQEEVKMSDILSAIDDLPSGARTVVLLHLIEEVSHKEIARELGISESTSKTQYMRGKRLLKEKLKNKGYGLVGS
ncbi:MAG: RNA polymerase sigma factor [Cyclobacteriaceae bacterium]